MRHLTLAAAAALALCAATASMAASYRLGQIEVGQPWSRPAAAGMNGVGFMTLTNHGGAADTLTAVESPAARKVEMHQTSMAGGMMSMQRLDAGVALPAGQNVSFAPTGRHLMFVGLVKPLASGDHLPATLVFASGARLQVEFAVGTGAPAPGEHQHH